VNVFDVLRLVAAVSIPCVVSILASLVCLSVTGGDSTRYEKGRELFLMRCAGCHSIDGSGQRSFGPPLLEIGKVGAERKSGMTAPEYILESIVSPGAFRAPGTTGGMPEGLVDNRDDIRQLVGFLATRGATVRDEEIDNLEIPDIVRKPSADLAFDLRKVEFGEDIFRGKGQCISCHPLRPDPALTLRGPNLLSIGSLTADDLRRAIEEPGAKIAREYQQVVTQTKDGSMIEGRLVEKTDDGIYILKTNPDGSLATVLVSFRDMESLGGNDKPNYLISKTSIMPSFKGLLTREEIDALVAFLKNRHGSYDW
jgi:putative heme-binding domain-containing protein